MMLGDLRTLFGKRELLWIWTEREIRIRYKQSLLGACWAVLQPLSLMLVFTVVFSFIVHVPTGDVPYPLFSYVAVLPWTFFSSSIALGVPTLVTNMNMVTKVSMPREILPVAAVLASLFDLGVAALLFVGMAVFYRVPPTWSALWVAPLLGIELILALGVALLGSALNVLYRDIRFLVPLLTQLWMYATPIIYPLDLIPARFRFLMYLNPMTAVIEGYRQAIIHGSNPEPWGIGVALLISSLVLAFAYLSFKRLERVFADII